MRSGLTYANVAAWGETVDAVELFLSVISLEELAIGVLLKERTDPAQGMVPRRWLEDQVVAACADAAVTLRSADLRVPDPRPVRDGWIAATALVHGLCGVTRNLLDFPLTGVAVFDLWQPG